MSFRNVFIIGFFLLIGSNSFSQSVLSKIDSEINKSLKFPWAGGMNAVQYGEIDINLDGIKDLVAFDRRGNRTMCFINKGVPNSADYNFSNQFTDQFPEFYEWVIFRDYDLDGRTDIFTYSPGYAGIIVYRNISVTSLKFEQVVYPYLKSLYPGGEVNLYVTYADYPGIADIDMDGDLDILTFGVLGSFIDMHKNMSMEKYGNADSLEFEHYTYCWGYVAESDESNEIYLDTCFSNKTPNIAPRHIGSTFMVHDLDDNGLVDVLLGDVDFPQLFALYNGGTMEEAYITSYDSVYPEIENVELFSMPCASYIDVDNNGVKDLLVSPFDPGPTTSRNKKSSWYYSNSGINSQPEFSLVEKDFLQSEMIDVGTGAYPVIFDWDGDGLKDLFIGNYGYYWYSYYESGFLKTVYYSSVAYYKNIGSLEEPQFQLWDKNFANLDELRTIGLIPAFDDVDGDGDTDILVGKEDGRLIFVKNMGNNNFIIENENFNNIDIGDFSAPQLFDLDNDGDKDLVIGSKGGTIVYYSNESSSSTPIYEFITDSLGKVNVTDYTISYDGYSVPSFFRNNGSTGLIVGSEKGKVFYFTNIDGNLSGEFTESDNLHIVLDTNSFNTDRGMRTAAVITDLIDNDKLEMIVGNYSGGLEFFNGSAGVNTNTDNIYAIEKLEVYPNPSNDKIFIALESAENYSMELYNAKGATLNPGYSLLENGLELNVAHLQSGFYILLLKNHGQLFSARFLVIR